MKCIPSSVLVGVVAVSWGAAGCGTQEAVTPAPPSRPVETFEPTRIKEGIYSGTVSCEVEVWTADTGTYPGQSGQFNETFTFLEGGVPAPGPAYDPQDDRLEVGELSFNITNRTAHTTSSSYLEEAAMVGFFEGNRLTGNITWRFTYVSDDAVDYALDIFYQGVLGNVSGTHTESCSGTLASVD